MNSLKWRLSIGLSISLLVIFVLAVFALGTALEELGRNSLMSRLRQDGEALLAQLRLAPDGKPLLDDAAISPVFRRPYSGRYFIIATGGDRLFSPSLWDASLPPLPALPPGESRSIHVPGPGEQELLLLSRGFRKAGQDITITVAENFTPIRENIRNTQINFSLSALGFLTLLVLWQLLLVHTGLRTFVQLRRQLGEIEAGHRKQIDCPVPDEIRPLVDELNQMLERLDRRLSRSRQAMGDLAHALKRPLTLLSHLTEQNGGIEDVRLRTQIRNIGNEMQQTIERVLKRARLAGEGSSLSRFNPARDIPELLDAIGKIHHQRKLHLEASSLPDVPVAMDREDALELFGNLLDNAAKWATGQVRISGRMDGGWRICIEDDGPGIPEVQLEALLRAGQRADEAVAGHGLGLAIARHIAEDYGARLRFDRASELGGLRVCIEHDPSDTRGT